MNTLQILDFTEATLKFSNPLQNVLQCNIRTMYFCDFRAVQQKFMFYFLQSFIASVLIPSKSIGCDVCLAASDSGFRHTSISRKRWHTTKMKLPDFFYCGQNKQNDQRWDGPTLSVACTCVTDSKGLSSGSILRKKCAGICWLNFIEPDIY